MELTLSENTPQRPVEMLLLDQAGPAWGSVGMGTRAGVQEHRGLLLKRPALGLLSLLPGQSSHLHQHPGTEGLVPPLLQAVLCGGGTGRTWWGWRLQGPCHLPPQRGHCHPASWKRPSWVSARALQGWPDYAGGWAKICSGNSKRTTVAERGTGVASQDARCKVLLRSQHSHSPHERLSQPTESTDHLASSLGIHCTRFAWSLLHGPCVYLTILWVLGWGSNNNLPFGLGCKVDNGCITPWVMDQTRMPGFCSLDHSQSAGPPLTFNEL